MTTKNELFGLPKSAIKKMNEVFNHYSEIHKVIIFGSRAMGNYRLGSDIDLCIESENFTFSQLLKIENQLDDLLLPWKIDLVLKRTIDNPLLIDHINQDGVIFYDHSDSNRLFPSGTK